MDPVREAPHRSPALSLLFELSKSHFRALRENRTLTAGLRDRCTAIVLLVRQVVSVSIRALRVLEALMRAGAPPISPADVRALLS